MSAFAIRKYLLSTHADAVSKNYYLRMWMMIAILGSVHPLYITYIFIYIFYTKYIYLPKPCRIRIGYV
jgi:hypothetical protein